MQIVSPRPAKSLEVHKEMRIGLDFDNTIVCYDEAIKVLASKLLNLPTMVARTKMGVRDYLREHEGEEVWTAFQGELYGPGMKYAKPFKGAISTMQKLKKAGHELYIISHRSRRPYAGKPHDLHKASSEWVTRQLQSVGLFKPVGETNFVYFLETRREKIIRIKELQCNVFVDDLAEVLTAGDFPEITKKILFDPIETTRSRGLCYTEVASSWDMLLEIIEGM